MDTLQSNHLHNRHLTANHPLIATRDRLPLLLGEIGTALMAGVATVKFIDNGMDHDRLL